MKWQSHSAALQDAIGSRPYTKNKFNDGDVYRGHSHWSDWLGVKALSPSLSVSPRRKNGHGALANVHEWSPSLLSPSFVKQVARRCVEFVEFEYYCACASEIR